MLNKAIFGHVNKKNKFPKIKGERGSSIQRTKDYSILKEKFNLDDEVIKQFENDELRLINIFQDDKGIDIKVDHENNRLKLEIKKPPYIPLNVFRVFLKMAFSMMKETDVQHFKNIKHLFFNDLPDHQKNELILYRYEIPILKNYFMHPIATLYCKHSESNTLCDKIFVLYFENKIYQIPIFSDDNYQRWFEGKGKIDILKISPYINPKILYDEIQDDEFVKSLDKVKEYRWNLSSHLLEKNDKEYMNLKIKKHKSNSMHDDHD